VTTGKSCISRDSTRQLQPIQRSFTNENFPSSGTIAYEGVSCTGSTLEACVGGRLTNVDCTTQGPGFGCQTVGTVSFCGLAADCVPAGNGAASESHPPSCDGTTLTFCSAGRLEHINCLSLGFTGCDVERAGHYGCIPGAEL
jgi:hypothetical protein